MPFPADVCKCNLRFLYMKVLPSLMNLYLCTISTPCSIREAFLDDKAVSQVAPQTIVLHSVFGWRIMKSFFFLFFSYLRRVTFIRTKILIIGSGTYPSAYYCERKFDPFNLFCVLCPSYVYLLLKIDILNHIKYTTMQKM